MGHAPARQLIPLRSSRLPLRSSPAAQADGALCACHYYPCRHMWGDKDTWALAAVFLASTDQASTWKISMADPMAHCAAIPETTTMSRAKSTRPSSAFQVHHSNGDSTKSQGAGAAMLYGSVGGSHVGWFLNHDDTPPSALWGHVQFSRAGGSSDGPDLQGATGASSRDSGVPFVDKSVGEGSTLHGPHGHRLRPRPIDEHPSRLLYLNWQPHYMQVNRWVAHACGALAHARNTIEWRAFAFEHAPACDCPKCKARCRHVGC